MDLRGGGGGSPLCVSVAAQLTQSEVSSPVEEGLRQVVLGSILRLHPSLQEHLLVKLLLLLLLLQVLLNPEALPVILLHLLRSVETLDYTQMMANGMK